MVTCLIVDGVSACLGYLVVCYVELVVLDLLFGYWFGVYCDLLMCWVGWIVGFGLVIVLFVSCFSLSHVLL